eukprot:2225147-Pleurochrysis_carterae.AAC.1
MWGSGVWRADAGRRQPPAEEPAGAARAACGAGQPTQRAEDRTREPPEVATWRATLPRARAPTEMDARTRRATAETIAARVEEMGLGGALGSEALDRWGPGGPSAEAAANVTHLRTAARAR